MKRIFKWIFSSQLDELQSKINQADSLIRHIEKKSESVDSLLQGIDLSVDVNYQSRSWAAISIQGKVDYIKFIDLGQRDVREIQGFLRQFERSKNIKVDADPITSKILKSGE